MTLELRPYQRAAIDAIYDYFAAETGHPLLVLPTASGKSLVMAAFIQEVLAQWPAERIVILTHVRELISQNFAELIRLWPEAPAGIYSAGLNRRDAQAQICSPASSQCTARPTPSSAPISCWSMKSISYRAPPTPATVTSSANSAGSTRSSRSSG
jgi:hypothetical protein